MVGRVVSTKMNNQSLPTNASKTATVLVERLAIHPLYKKAYKQSKKYLVDVQINVKDGDVVEIEKIRPISKNKHWRIVKVVGRNLEEITETALKAEAEKIVAEVMPEEKTEESSDVNPQPEVKTTEKPKKSNKRKEKKSDS